MTSTSLGDPSPTVHRGKTCNALRAVAFVTELVVLCKPQELGLGPMWPMGRALLATHVDRLVHLEEQMMRMTRVTRGTLCLPLDVVLPVLRCNVLRFI